MRCTNCKVDVADNHQICPLCGEKLGSTPNVMHEIRASEYPQGLIPKPTIKGIRKILFFVYICLGAGLMVLEKVLTGYLEYSLKFIMAIPCVWAVIIRPIAVKKEYVGSYIILDVIYTSIAAFLLGLRINGNLLFNTQVIIPVICIIAILILTGTSLVFPQKSILSVVYVLPITLLCAVLTVIGCFTHGYYAPLAAGIGTLCGCVSLLISKVRDSSGFNAQMKSRFFTG